MTLMRRLSLIVLVIAAAGFAASGRADTLGERMDVTANVVANCRLTVPPLSFGTYDPLDTNSVQPADASTIVIVSCTRNTSAFVALDFGRNAVSNGDRAMSGPGSEHLEYQIYRDAARSQVWANGADAVRFFSHGISTPEQITVFGRILPRQEVEPGAYIDVLTATVDF
jgi:spore coat protein U domain-containing protein, fimbrial subunit CupE1/2/3/6